MASLEKRRDGWRIRFSWAGERPSIPLGPGLTERQAKARLAAVERLLARLRRGDVAPPDGCSVGTFLLHDGHPPAPDPDAGPALGWLRDRYLAAREGAVRPNTLEMLRIHFRHLCRTWPEDTPLSGVHPQDHVDRRKRARHKGRPLDPATIRKEITTLKAAWEWARDLRMLDAEPPAWGRLEYPHPPAPKPWMTWEQCSASPDPDAWGGLFLRPREVAELLAHAAAHPSRKRRPWVHPALATAAFTGMRRAELMRARRADVDLARRLLMVRELKKARGRETFRWAPLSAELADVLRRWLRRSEPFGSEYLFPYRRKFTRDHAPLTPGVADAGVKLALAGSKWEKVKGWHVLRHSFISACVAAGVDQRTLDGWVGHTTRIREKYTHLAPEQSVADVDRVFGGGEGG
jgi:integrase